MSLYVYSIFLCKSLPPVVCRRAHAPSIFSNVLFINWYNRIWLRRLKCLTCIRFGDMLTNLYVFHLLDTSIYIYIKCNKEHPRNKTHNSIFTYIIKIYFTITYSVGFRTVCQLLL